MVYLCLVKDCNNSSKLTMGKCKMFRVPKDELLSKQWLINCNRQDLLRKSLVHFKVCSDHFQENMYSCPKRTVLLPSAVPTDFSLIFKKDSCNSSYLDTMSSDPLLFNNSVSMNNPSEQKDSSSYSCLPSTSLSDSVNCSIPSSTQTTQLTSLHTVKEKKYRDKLREIKNKYKLLEQKFEALSQEVTKKNSANKIDVNSVDLFNQVVEAQLPPNLCIVLKRYVQGDKRQIFNVKIRKKSMKK